MTLKESSTRFLLGYVLLVALGWAVASPANLARAERDASSPVPLTAEILAPPSPVLATDENRHVVYEIVVQNVSSHELVVERLKVIDAGRGTDVASYRGGSIAHIMVGSEGSTRTLAPGAFGALFIDLTLPPHHHIPDRLVHRFVLAVQGSEEDDPLRMVAAPTNILRRQEVTLGPPLHGGNLLDVNGCCSESPHARAITEIDDQLFVSQRYAIDFLRLFGESTFAGDPTMNQSYFIFGDKVIATAPGRIVAVRDGLPENTPPNSPPEPDLATAFGNFVTQRVGGGRFATYGHLHTGSIRVGVGERVKRGQVLGLVGNTGNSSEPHLHLQVTDGDAGFGSNGLPFVFRRFALDGRVVGLESGTPTIVPADPPRIRRKQLPLNFDIVAFPRAEK